MRAGNAVGAAAPAPPGAAWQETAVTAAALALTASYAFAFPIWQSLAASVGAAGAGRAPIALLVALAAATGLMVWRWRRAGKTVRLSYLMAAGVLAVTAIAATDPEFPAKRIHAPQYFFLA